MMRHAAQPQPGLPCAPRPPRSTSGYEEPLIARHARAEEEGTSAGLDGGAPGVAAMERGGGGGGAAVVVQEEEVTYNYSQVGLVFEGSREGSW